MVWKLWLWNKNRLKEFQQNWQIPFQKAFSEKFVLMKLEYLKENGELLLDDKKQFIQVYLWGLSLLNKKVNINYMDFGMLKKIKLLIIG